MERERRRSERVPVDLEVDYRCEDTFLFAYITDISAIGVFVRSANPYPSGTHLGLRFKLPGEERPLLLEGEVMWTQTGRELEPQGLHAGMGIRFVNLSATARERLVGLVGQGGAVEH